MLLRLFTQTQEVGFFIFFFSFFFLKIKPTEVLHHLHLETLKLVVMLQNSITLRNPGIANFHILRAWVY